MVECAKHELLQPFSVLNEKEGEPVYLQGEVPRGICVVLNITDNEYVLCFCLSGEFVAQFKFTVMLMANGPHKITGTPFEAELYKSEYEVQDAELRVRIAAPLGSTYEPTYSGVPHHKAHPINILKYSYLLLSLDFAPELSQPQNTEEKEKEGTSTTEDLWIKLIND